MDVYFGHTMKRATQAAILKDLDKKAVLLSGPRQAGKTTLSRALFEQHDYLNFDSAKDRIKLKKELWDREKPLVIFDELHKMKAWKAWLKGVIDTEGVRPRILVTGSARLDISKRMGDSLAGRFFAHRLYPLTLAELKNEFSLKDALNRLLNLSNFPEPFLANESGHYEKWKRSHLELILRQDLPVLETVKDIVGLETLIELLKSRVGSTISFASLGRDLDRDPSTVKRWLNLLESLFVIFRVTPYSKNIARALLKEPKFYFFDLGQVEAPPEAGLGPKLENLVALALLTEQHRREDGVGVPRAALHFIRTKEKRELDFVLVGPKGPKLVVEVKASDSNVSASFGALGRHLGVPKVQLVHADFKEYTTSEGVAVRKLGPWLQEIETVFDSFEKPSSR